MPLPAMTAAPDAATTGAATTGLTTPAVSTGTSPSSPEDTAATDGEVTPEDPPTSNAPPILGTACGAEGWSQCAGAAQMGRRICQGGVWTQAPDCLLGENCDQPIGLCEPIIGGCLGREPGFRFCDSDGAASVCGADLTRVEMEGCANGCVDGYCVGACDGSTSGECDEADTSEPSSTADDAADSEDFGASAEPTSTSETTAAPVVAICGDFIPQPGEACDDGNLAINDGCTPECRAEVCGDRVIQSNEGCDDGNKNSNDGCNSQCRREFCGDNVKQNNEGCDDGNSAPDDSCNAKCETNRPLEEYEGSCNDATGGQSRSQACVSAVRRYCSDMSGDLNLEAGVVQEIGAADDVFGVGCLTIPYQDTVSFDDLEGFDKGCGDPANSQKLACLEAAHYYCQDTHGKEFGMIQGVSGNNATVVCDDVIVLVTVQMSALTEEHSNCNVERAATADCAAAAHRFCSDFVNPPNGYEAVGGYVQTVSGEQVEADSYEVEVACLPFKLYNPNVKVGID